jgi:hypothetical protein
VDDANDILSPDQAWLYALIEDAKLPDHPSDLAPRSIHHMVLSTHFFIAELLRK